MLQQQKTEKPAGAGKKRLCGWFVTTIDFGPGLLNGSNYWLEVEVSNPGESCI